MTGLYPGGPRRPRERALPAGELSARRGAAAAGGLPYDRVRVVVRAGAAVRARPRFRRLRRRASRKGGRSVARPRLPPAVLAELAASGPAAALRLGPLQRSARALRSARAVHVADTRPLRISVKWRPWTSSSDASWTAFTSQVRGPRAVDRRRRSWRGARRSRRGAARQPGLPVDDARAAGDRGTGRDAGRRRRRRSASGGCSTPSWTGPGSARRTACAAAMPEVVLGEGMKPFLEYGWQPQVMAVSGTQRRSSQGSSRPTTCATTRASRRT